MLFYLFIYLYMKSRYKQSKCFRFQYIWAYFISYYFAPFHIQHNNNIVITKMWWKRNDSIFALDFSWYGKPYTEKKPIVTFSQNIMLASFYASISRFHWQYLMVYQNYVKIFHRLMDKSSKAIFLVNFKFDVSVCVTFEVSIYLECIYDALKTKRKRVRERKNYGPMQLFHFIAF